MPTRKKATKASKTKARKTSATKTASARPRRKKTTPSDHLGTAHKHVVRVLDSVTLDDVDAIQRLRRLVDHAHENARRAK